jgi:hypothetical protein
MTKAGLSLEDRFLSHTWAQDNEQDMDCLIWTGTLQSQGYGLTWANGKVLLAHRVAWEMYRGSIPKGMHVLHKCDRRNCVKVDHLFLGTNKQNVEDKISKGRDTRGETNGKATVTDAQRTGFDDTFVTTHGTSRFQSRDCVPTMRVKGAK